MGKLFINNGKLAISVPDVPIISESRYFGSAVSVNEKGARKSPIALLKALPSVGLQGFSTKRNQEKALRSPLFRSYQNPQIK